MDGIQTPTAPPAEVTVSQPRPSVAPVSVPVLPPSEAPPLAEILLAWPREAQWAAAALVVAAALLLAANAWGLNSFWARPAALDEGDSCCYRVDLNQATIAELMQIPGVGPKLAERIVEYRREHGGFRNVQDLRNVATVGPKTYQRLLHWVCVDGISAEPAPQVVPPPVKEKAAAGPARDQPVPRKPAAAKAQVKKTKKIYKGPKLNINTATVDQLMQIDGIGPKKAQAIVTARTIRPFQSIDDLRRAKGIGPKTLAKLRPHVTLD
jgi:competence protein ComEA